MHSFEETYLKIKLLCPLKKMEEKEIEDGGQEGNEGGNDIAPFH